MRRASVALIDEPRCIGCTRCIDACPVDAIVGAQGFTHTVVAAWCTGCELCLAPCPVDCIAMVAPPAPWTQTDARAAAKRARERKARLAAATPPARDRERRRAIVARALARRRPG